MMSNANKLMTRGAMGILLVTISVLLSVQTCAAEDFVRRAVSSASRPLYAANQVLVTLHAGSTEEALAGLNAEYGSSVSRRLVGSNTYVVNLPGDGNPAEILIARESSILSKYPAILDIQFNYAYTPLVTPADEYFDAYYDTQGRLRGQWQFQPDPVDATIQHIRMPEAWDLQKGSSDVVVAVIDTGVRSTVLRQNGVVVRTPHPDLANRLLRPTAVMGPDGWIPPDVGAWDMDPSPSEEAGYAATHGTMVAGLIAAQGGDGIGISGTCWNGVRVLPVKACGDDTVSFYDSEIYNALEYCLRYRSDELSSTGEPLRVNVVNMSLGKQSAYSPVMAAQIRRVAAAGIIIVAASGDHWDQGAYPPGYPAALDEVICVGSTDYRDIISPWSQRGRTLDIVAPGENITTTAWSRDLATVSPEGSSGDDGGNSGGDGGGEEPPFTPSALGPSILAAASIFPDATGNFIAEFVSGTSFSAPIVSGVAALLLSHGVPAGDVKEILYSTATPKGTGVPNDTYGWGLLNAKKALERASIEVKIQTPANSSVVTNSRPRFRIDFRHANKSTIEVRIDGQLIIGGTNGVLQDWDRFYYTLDASAGKTYLLFDYPVSAGSHTITASAQSDVVFAAPPSVIPAATATSTFTARPNELNPGWHMFSVPYILHESVVPEHVIGYTAQLWRYAYADGATGSYAAYSPGGRMDAEATFQPPSVIGNSLVHPLDEMFATAPAGVGYWLKVRSTTGLAIPALDPSLASEVRGAPYSIGLYNGWNMVGCPFLSPTSWQTAVFDFGGLRLTAQEAVMQGWIANYIYSYDATRQAYVTAPVSSAVMQPWKSQWVRVKVGRDDSARIVNPTFSGEYRAVNVPATDQSTGYIGSNWSAYSTSGAGYFQVGTPGMADSTSQKISPRVSTTGYLRSGMWQDVAVLPGQQYSFSVWTKRLMDCSSVIGACRWPIGEGTRVGIDPTGGTDPMADTVIWSTSMEGLVGQWTQQTTYAQAQSSNITVFVEVVAYSPGLDRIVYIDDARISGGHDVTLIVNP